MSSLLNVCSAIVVVGIDCCLIVHSDDQWLVKTGGKVKNCREMLQIQGRNLTESPRV